jgi:hypothetical protein
MARPTSPASSLSTVACAEVRERLDDYVLGALLEDDTRRLSRHLEWCAGCRKELAELEEGVAAVGLALEPIAPPAELEAKVLERVVEAAGARARERRRFRIVTTIAVLATFFGVAALGYAAAVTGRLERLQAETATAVEQAKVLEGLVDAFGGQQILPARLAPVEGRQGGGQAVVYLSGGESSDWVLVIAGGLPQGQYHASLVHGSGIEVPIGEMFPNREGQVSAYRFFTQDLTSFRRIVVTNGAGQIVLRGVIQPVDAG